MAERLAAEGHDVEVVTTFPHYPEWRFADGRPPRTSDTIERGVRTRRLRHRLPRAGSSVSRVLSELSFGVHAVLHSLALRALSTRWGRPDAVVLVSPALFASALLVPFLRIGRLPFVVWVQDLYGLGIRETGAGDRHGLLASSIGRLEGWMLRSADSVVVIHEGMAAEVAALGVEQDRIAVVRNWTHIATTPLEDRAGVRASFGWSAEETVVLHTGNMGAKQDLENVVSAAGLADQRSAAVRFVLMGDGAMRERIETAAIGVERLQILPPQDDQHYQQLLQAADVLLVNEHPGLRGMALPSKLTSYFAAGRPVLAATSSESATAAELGRGSTGQRIDAGDPGAMLDAVEDLAGDPAQMRRLAEAGLRYRHTVLSVAGASGEFLRTLLTVVQNRAPKSVDEVPVLVPAPSVRAAAESAAGGLTLDPRPLDALAREGALAMSASALSKAQGLHGADANDRV